MGEVHNYLKYLKYKRRFQIQNNEKWVLPRKKTKQNKHLKQHKKATLFNQMKILDAELQKLHVQ